MSKASDNSSFPVTRLITRPDETAALQIRKATLRVIKGPDRGKSREVTGGGGLVVGSSPECDFALSDPAVSRRHFELVVGEAGFVIRDLGSKNGTLVAGLRLGSATLAGGEEIQLGSSRLCFELSEESEEYPISPRSSFGPLLGRSYVMRQVFAILERAAESDSTLLLTGESGTGKDLAAEAVHQHSARRERPFAIVDCGAMGASLIESELFGHKKGAFTGADSDRPSVFEAAQGGTVFLDEIGELASPLQQKLLRLLENREIKRLGENHFRTVDIRLIAATNRDLTAEVEAGRFRQDLFYRLSVIRVHFPPLRDRREDIGPIARAIVQVLKPALDPAQVITDAVLAMLCNHDWPGNVRELRNVVERLLLFPDHAPASLLTQKGNADSAAGDLMGLPFHQARQTWNDRFEKAYLAAMLDACGGVVTRAAERSGIPRQTFHRLMAKHRLVK